MVIGQATAGPDRQLGLWLTESGYVYHVLDTSSLAAADAVAQPGTIPQHAVSVRFAGARKARIDALSPLPGTYNWLVGDASRHASGAKAFGQLIYRGIYPGIDAVFDVASETRIMETTYHVAPGGNPRDILLRYDGAKSIRIDAAGNLVVDTTLGAITELRPVAFQRPAAGPDEPVRVAFALRGNRLGFKVGAYDKTRALYIDPVVVFSRTFGGSGNDAVSTMHEDNTGRYLTGITASTDFPATAGAYQATTAGASDLFAAKFSTDNQTLLWATYVGSGGAEYGGNSALAGDGSLYLAASTQGAATWPGSPALFGPRGGFDIGIVHLSADGQSIVSSMVIGGTSADYAGDIALDGGNVYVCGSVNSPGTSNFPIGSGGGYSAAGSGGDDAYVLRVNGALSSYQNTVLIPGSTAFDGASNLAFDGAGNVYVSGTTLSTAPGSYPGTAAIGPGGNYDLFVAKYDAALGTQFYNTIIGGASTDPTAGQSYTSYTSSIYNTAYKGIAVDAANRAWVTGMSASTDFPTTPGAYQPANAGNYDVFVLALNAAGTALDHSTFVGGASTDVGRAIGFDSVGNVYVAGSSASTSYPTTPGVPQPSNGGNYDMVVSVLSPDLGQLLASTYWGGTGTDHGSAIRVGPDRAARVAGSSSGAFPVVPAGSPVFGPGGSYDGAVVSFTDLAIVIPGPPPPIPTLNPWVLLVLIGMAGLSFAHYLRRAQHAGRQDPEI